ncbi:MAG: hypothetical protein J5I50_10760 [Chitinophagaceae bacterium]|nr:hypothetical protein [Chitinophagaceae bacterium]
MKQRIIFLAAAVLLVFGLFFFGKTVGEKPQTVAEPAQSIAPFNATGVIDSLKLGLSPELSGELASLESKLREDNAQSYYDVADFWKDSVGKIVPYIYYLSKASELENSEKNLTFAAQFILENMRREGQLDLKLWEAQKAASLFEQALKLNPNSHDLKIGLGSCYVFGPGMTGDAQESMKGIQKLLEVEREDSNNMRAQMVLGIASVISNQTNKGIERLQKVVDFDPNNLEAISWLADAYAIEGDVDNAIKWYEHSKHIVNNPAFSKEIDERIKMLKQQ